MDVQKNCRTSSAFASLASRSRLGGSGFRSCCILLLASWEIRFPPLVRRLCRCFLSYRLAILLFHILGMWTLLFPSLLLGRWCKIRFAAIFILPVVYFYHCVLRLLKGSLKRFTWNILFLHKRSWRFFNCNRSVNVQPIVRLWRSMVEKPSVVHLSLP